MSLIIISDLHLQPHKPFLTEAFLTFLQKEAIECEHLYILGDFFEAWIGDDYADPFTEVLTSSLAEYTAAGHQLSFMHGNRDFLLGDRFLDQTGATMLPDPSLIEAYGQTALLMHGDTLCIDDVDYQNFRQMVRNPEWQAGLLAKPIRERLQMAQQLREVSKEKTQQKMGDIMDVNQEEVVRVMNKYKVNLLIHGHTHRPAVHKLSTKQGPSKRYVLGDWGKQGWFIRWDEAGIKLEAFDLS